jgi:hypothetical protein
MTTTTQSIFDNERWLLSFYRNSEVSGALFFGRLARSMRPGPIHADMTKHFADESQHAWYWTKALKDLNLTPIRVIDAYQDKYLEAAGMPVNLMEVLAITQVFEIRVIGQYAKHRALPGLHPIVGETISTIMQDEKWHIQWVGAALKDMETEYGAEHVQTTMKRFLEADRQVYATALKEHEERMSDLFDRKGDYVGIAQCSG